LKSTQNVEVSWRVQQERKRLRTRHKRRFEVAFKLLKGFECRYARIRQKLVLTQMHVCLLRNDPNLTFIDDSIYRRTRSGIISAIKSNDPG